MKMRYEYSSELKGQAIGTIYDMSELALSGKMDKVIRFISWQMNSYKSKIADIQKGSFQASDGIEIPFYTFTPKEKREKYPAIVYYHGGGFMFPIQKAMMDNSALYASNCGVKVFLPDYRIVPRVDCKRVNDDCYEMLRYVFQNASQLQVDPEQVILYGDSAGGCLAANAAIRNRDEDRFPLLAQMLLYPVCDNESWRYESVDEYEYGVWSKKANDSMWKLFFHNGCEEIRRVVPMKNDCHGLPQAYVEPQEMDVLRDEAIAYANKLKAAGVETECNLIVGSYHGFDAELKSPLVKRVFEHRYQVIRRFIRQTEEK